MGESGTNSAACAPLRSPIPIALSDQGKVLKPARPVPSKSASCPCSLQDSQPSVTLQHLFESQMGRCHGKSSSPFAQTHLLHHERISGTAPILTLRQACLIKTFGCETTAWKPPRTLKCSSARNDFEKPVLDIYYSVLGPNLAARHWQMTSEAASCTTAMLCLARAISLMFDVGLLPACGISNIPSLSPPSFSIPSPHTLPSHQIVS